VAWFERIGSELSLSPSHVDRYYRAAELVLDRAFPVASARLARSARPRPRLRYGGGKISRRRWTVSASSGRCVTCSFPARSKTRSRPTGSERRGRSTAGSTKLRIQASGIRPLGGQPAHLSIGKRTGEETVDGLIEFDITAPEDKPQVYEFEVFLEMPATLDFCVVATDVVDRRARCGLPQCARQQGRLHLHAQQRDLLLNPNAPQMFDDKGNGLFSTVLLDWIEWEGTAGVGGGKVAAQGRGAAR
jgi:hypothetical protein